MAGRHQGALHAIVLGGGGPGDLDAPDLSPAAQQGPRPARQAGRAHARQCGHPAQEVVLDRERALGTKAGRGGAERHVVFVQLLAERPAGDAQQLGGARLVAGAAGERIQDGPLLDLDHGWRMGGAAVRGTTGGGGCRNLVIVALAGTR